MQFTSFHGLSHYGIYKKWSAFGTKIFTDICPRTLSVLSENCELRRTDNVKGQISEHLFALNRGYYVYYLSKIFRNTHDFQNWGIS